MHKLFPESVDDILADPSRYGFPTFDEFKRNPELLNGRDDEILASADAGSQWIKDVKRHVYEIEGYRCKTLEQVEEIAARQGIPLRELDYRPVMTQAGAGKYDIIVRFVRKSMIDRRRNAVA